MRDNIDLTSNRMFRSKNDMSIHTFVFSKYPWKQPVFDLVTAEGLDDEILHGRYMPLVRVGNKSDRREVKMLVEIDSNDYCDCCGAYLKTIPWDRTYGLCRKCNTDMHINYGNNRKMPWYEREEMRPNRSSMYAR